MSLTEHKMILRLHRGWDYISTSNGVEIWSFHNQRRFHVQGEPSVLNKLLTALRGGIPADNGMQTLIEVTRLTQNQVESLVQRWRQLGIVLRVPEEEKTPESRERALYDPQIEFFDRWEQEGLSGRELDQRLRNRRVVLVGVGGFGSWIALLLSRIGIRQIVAVDGDHVETSNLSRQILYTQADKGKLKVQAAAQRMREADSNIQFEAHPLFIRKPEDLLPLIEEADLVFNPFGYLPIPIGQIIAQACIQAGVPFLVSGACVVGPLCIPGHTPCHQCLIHLDSNLSETRNLIQTSGWRPPSAPFAPPMAVTSAYVVWEAARFLSGCDQPPTLGGMYVLDPLNYSIEFRPGQRQSTCSLCGEDVNLHM